MAERWSIRVHIDGENLDDAIGALEQILVFADVVPEFESRNTMISLNSAKRTIQREPKEGKKT